MVKLVISIILGFSLSVITLRVLLKFFNFSLFLDQPNSSRKQHKKAIPRFGGVGFVFTIFITLLATNTYTDVSSWYFVGAFLIWILGALDDSLNLNWYIKLPTQLLVGVVLFIATTSHLNSLSMFSDIQVGTLSYFLLLFVWIFWFLGMVNAVNLCDGLDGLAAGLVVLSLLGVSTFGLSTFHLIIASALGGFLVFNKYPAKLYMGDSGSLFLGYHLATIPLIYFTSNSSLSFDLLAYLIMNTYFIWDTSRVVLVRLLNKQNPFKPDQNHYHFILLNQNTSVVSSVIRIWLLHAFFIGCAITMISFHYHVSTWFLFVLGLTYLFLESVSFGKQKKIALNLKKS